MSKHVITRRGFLSTVLPAVAAAGCSRSDPVSTDRGRDSGVAESRPPVSTNAPRLKLTTAKTPGVLCMISWMVAAERGYFDAEGLAVEFLEQDWAKHRGHHLNSPWLSGPTGPVRNDLVVVEYPSLQDMASGEFDYYVVAGEHSGCRQIVCPVESPIRTIADLRGKRIGLRPAEDTLIWENLIDPARVSPGATKWIRAPYPAGDPREIDWAKEEFAAGRIDAHVSGDPVPEILKADGIARLVASNTWTPPLNGWYCCMLAVRRELVDRHPDLPGRFTRAIRAAAALVEKDPAAQVAFLVDKGYFPPSTRQDLSARVLGEYVWATTGRIEQDLERYFQLLIDAGRIKGSVSPAELVRRVYRGGDA